MRLPDLILIFITWIITGFGFYACAQELPLEKKSKLVEWHGNISMLGQYSNYTPQNQYQPPEFYQISSSQTLTLAQIPFRGNVFLSSFNSTALNQISFSIDQQTLQNNIQKRVEAKINELEADNSIAAFDNKIKQSFPEENNYKNIDRYNTRLDKAKNVNVADAAQYQELMQAQDQLKKYDPEKYQDYRDYVKLKSLNERTDYQQNLKWLEQQNLINSYEQFWYNFNQVQLGTTRPYFSKYDLAGIPVNGYYFAYDNRYLFLSAASGMVLPYGSALSSYDYNRSLKAYKAGVGKSNTSHLHLNYVNGLDKNSNDSISPQANSITGVEGKAEIFNKQITLAASAFGNFFTADIGNTETRGNTVEREFGKNSYSSWISKEVKENSSTSYSYAYHLDLSYQNKIGTYLTGRLEHVEPFYQSMGVAYLQNDLHRYRISAKQSLFNRKVNVMTQVKIDQDNLDRRKKLTSRNTNAIFKVRAALKNMPRITISYMPNYYTNGIRKDSARYKQESHLTNILLSRAYAIGNLHMNTHVTITHNYYTTGKMSFNSVLSMLHHQVSLNQKINTGLRVVYRTSNNYNYWSATPDLSVRIKPNGRVYFSFQYGQDHTGSTRNGISAGINMTILKKIYWNLNLRQNYYAQTNTINDFVARTSLGARW